MRVPAAVSYTHLDVYKRQVQPTETFEDLYDGNGPLQLASAKALVINQYTGEVIYEKNTKEVTPIASVTKLMTAMVVLDAKLPMDEVLYISEDDIDYLKGTRSRLSVGTCLLYTSRCV